LRPASIVEDNVGVFIAVGAVVDDAEVVEAGGVGREGEGYFVGCVGEGFYVAGTCKVVLVRRRRRGSV
jgi:hypothetical protein